MCTSRQQIIPPPSNSSPHFFREISGKVPGNCCFQLRSSTALEPDGTLFSTLGTTSCFPTSVGNCLILRSNRSRYWVLLMPDNVRKCPFYSESIRVFFSLLRKMALFTDNVHYYHAITICGIGTSISPLTSFQFQSSVNRAINFAINNGSILVNSCMHLSV